MLALAVLGIFTFIFNNTFAQSLPDPGGDPEATITIREVKNYDLQIWLFWNNSSKMDADDCKVKDCAIYSENGKCIFVTF